MQTLRAQEGVVQVQVGGEEFWKITLLNHLQKDGHGCGQSLVISVKGAEDKYGGFDLLLVYQVALI